MLVTGNRDQSTQREREKTESEMYPDQQLMYTSGADKKTGEEMGNTHFTPHSAP